MVITFENSYCKALLRDMLLSMRNGRYFDENISLIVYTYAKNNNFAGFVSSHFTFGIDSKQYNVDKLDSLSFNKTVMSYKDLAKLVNI